MTSDEAKQLVSTMRSSKISLQTSFDAQQFDIEFPKSILPSEIDLINEREKGQQNVLIRFMDSVLRMKVLK
ncbi:hypothetical protein ACGO3R_02795 [Lactococcus lactis]